MSHTTGLSWSRSAVQHPLEPDLFRQMQFPLMTADDGGVAVWLFLWLRIGQQSRTEWPARGATGPSYLCTITGCDALGRLVGWRVSVCLCGQKCTFLQKRWPHTVHLVPCLSFHTSEQLSEQSQIGPDICETLYA